MTLTHLRRSLALLAALATTGPALADSGPVSNGIVICDQNGQNCAPGDPVGPPPGSPPYDQRVCGLEGTCPPPPPPCDPPFCSRI